MCGFSNEILVMKSSEKYFHFLEQKNYYLCTGRALAFYMSKIKLILDPS